MGETPSSPTLSPKHEWLAKLAKEKPDEALTTLAHVIDLEWLREAHRRTRKDGARGVDGQSAEQYAEHLEDNLRSLLDRAKSGAYRAPPGRRVHIPKGEGAETRPLGIPTFEDKVLQRAVAMVLEAVYEPLFVEGSYGFRPGRSAHDALEALREGLMAMAGGWIVEVDIVKFFDRLDHEKLGAILRRRARDRVLLRLNGQRLKAGVLEAGENAQALARLRDQVVKIGRKWLDRRSQKAKVMWERLEQILRHHPLPPARRPAGRA